MNKLVVALGGSFVWWARVVACLLGLWLRGMNTPFFVEIKFHVIGLLTELISEMETMKIWKEGRRIWSKIYELKGKRLNKINFGLAH